jgi:hypothetical protein
MMNDPAGPWLQCTTSISSDGMRPVKSAAELWSLFNRGFYCAVRWPTFGPGWTLDAPIVAIRDGMILVDHWRMQWWRIDDPGFLIVTSAPEEEQ